MACSVLVFPARYEDAADILLRGIQSDPATGGECFEGMAP